MGSWHLDGFEARLKEVIFGSLDGCNRPWGVDALHPPLLPLLQCRDVCRLNASDRCDFIRTNPDCHSKGGYLDYLEGIFCHSPPHLLPLVITFYVRSHPTRGCWAGRVAPAGSNAPFPLRPPPAPQAFWLLYLFLILGVTAGKL